MVYHFFMNQTEVLKGSRNLLLKLHKSLVDQARDVHEIKNGPVTPASFLTLLIENKDFDWLRRFSELIVEIDEMFARRDGFSDDEVSALSAKTAEIVDMKNTDESFNEAFSKALENNFEAQDLRKDIIELVSE